MPIPDDQTRSELTSTTSGTSSYRTRTQPTSRAELEQLWQLYIENSSRSPTPPRSASEILSDLPEWLSQTLHLPTRPLENWVRDDLLFDLTATRVERDIASQATQPTSSKARNTYKEFSQRIESTE